MQNKKKMFSLYLFHSYFLQGPTDYYKIQIIMRTTKVNKLQSNIFLTRNMKLKILKQVTILYANIKN